MKKVYHRPELYYECFSLGTSIAAGCEAIANFAENSCTVSLSGPGYDLELFQSSAICAYSPPNPGDYVCYQAPSENNNVFSS